MRFALLIFTLLVLPTLKVSAQSEKRLARIDTLEKNLVTQPQDSIRVRDLYTLAQLYYPINKEKLLIYARQGMLLSKKLAHPGLTADGYFIMAVGFSGIGRLDSAIYYNHLQLAIQQKVGDTTRIKASFYNLGNFHFYAGEYDSALVYFQKAMRMEIALHDTAGMADAYNSIGLIFMNKNAPDSALRCFYRSAQYQTLSSDSTQLANTLNNIALIYKEQNRFSESNIYLQKSLSLKKSSGDVEGLINTYLNLAANLGQMNRSSEAVQMAQNALELADSTHFIPGKADALGTLGRELNRLGKYEEAATKLKEAEVLYKKIGNPQALAICYVNLADSYWRQRKYSLGIPLIEQALSLLNKGENYKVLRSAYEIEANLYTLAGNVEKASLALNNFKIASDSVYKKDHIKSMAEAEARYNNAENEVRIKTLQQESQIQKLKAQKSESRLILVVLVSLLLISAMVFFVYYSRNKENQAAQKAILTEREQGLKAIINATEKERMRIAKDLHDGIGQQLSGLKMAVASIGNDLAKMNPAKKQQVEKINAVLDASCQDVRTISHLMMPKSLEQFGLVISIQDMLDKSLGVAGIEYDFETMRISDDARFPFEVELTLYRISQEVVTNIIRHSAAKKVQFQLLRTTDSLVTIIEDDGRGFNPEKASSGLGFASISSRLSTVKGNFSIDSAPGKGTVISIRILL